jgi:hypothetical protein
MDYAPLIISIVSLIFSISGFFHSKKTFLISFISERVLTIRNEWFRYKNNNSLTGISDNNWELCTSFVSELVSTIFIINKLSENYLIRIMHFKKPYFIIFRELLPTDLRTAINNYKAGPKFDINDKNLTIFQQQMNDIQKYLTNE